MSNGSAELPQNAIRRMISTVDTIQSLFPDLWVDTDSNDPQESASSGSTEPHIPNSSWNHVVQPYTGIPLKNSTRTDSSWPSTRTKDGMTPENPHASISRLMSTVATNQLLFPELWDPADKVQQDVSTDRFKVAYGSPSIWSHNQQQDTRLPINQKNTPESLARLERVDRSEDEDSSDSGIYSGTYLA